MPRRQRIAYENAHYHIFNRASSRKTLCFSQDHFAYFQSLALQLHDRYNIEIYSYCMMKNHYHLYLSTPEANISEAMWYFGMRFTRYVNQSLNGDGPLFRSRYRSVLVESDRYALNLSRYIHLNPVKAGLSPEPELYAWSSYQYYLDTADSPVFLNTSFLHNHFLDRSEFDEFTKLGVDNETERFYRKKRTDSIWGSREFIDQFS